MIILPSKSSTLHAVSLIGLWTLLQACEPLEENAAPNAVAGDDFTVNVGSRVQLDASASSDPEDAALSYAWKIVSQPTKSQITINSATLVESFFTADQEGTYEILLTVSDGTNEHTDNVIVTSELSEDNNIPIANAGPAQNIRTNSSVQLDGSNSYDLDNDPLSYHWELTAQPLGSLSSLDNADIVNPAFTPDIDGLYQLSLVVNDGNFNSQPATINVTSTTANSVPVADAGISQNVSTGSTVMLSGINSSDADNDNLSYQWRFTSIPSGSSTTLNQADSVMPNFVADIDGNYRIELMVSDALSQSQPVNVLVISATANSAPTADAGPNQNVSTGNLVNLNGSGSNDADGDMLNFNWVLSRPPGSTALLNSTSSTTPSFTTDVDGSYTATLTVFDGQVNSTADSVVITSTTANSAPVADAGANQSVSTGTSVSLDGSNSSDANNDSLSYNWNFVSRPTGSSAVLTNSSSITPSFTPDVDGSYVVSLVVNDGQANSLADNVSIASTTANSAPVANAGSDDIVTTGNTVTLNGNASSDANGDTLSYTWNFSSRPSGSTATLDNNTSITPSFTADVSGTYLISLVVNDGLLNSQADNVSIQSNTNVSDYDDFDGSGALTGYTTNNPNSLPDITQTNGRYRANLINNANDITLHFNNYQGRLDAKLISFPFEVIARNIGIGTQADSQTAPSPNGSQYIFAGLQVHVTNLNQRNSSHIVVGHRGGTQFTIEGKNTINGASTVDDAGYNIAPDGRIDLRVVGNSDGSLTIYWQQPNLTAQADNWQFYSGYAGGNGRLPGTAPNYGSSVYVGLITYAQGNSNIPFVGTCDSLEFIQL